MSTQNTIVQTPRAPRPRVQNPWEAGLPDPRPVTDYSVALSTVAGNTRVTITLGQPCVIRTPVWAFISATDGARSYAPTLRVLDNTSFFFEFAGALDATIGTIEVP